MAQIHAASRRSGPRAGTLGSRPRRSPSDRGAFLLLPALALSILSTACAPGGTPPASPSAPRTETASAAGSPPAGSDPAASAPATPAANPGAPPLGSAPAPSGGGAPAGVPAAPAMAATEVTAATPAGRPAAPAVADPSGDAAPSGGAPALPALPVVWAEARAADGASPLRVEGIAPVSRDSRFEVAVSVRTSEARLQLLDARDAVVPSSGSTVLADETRFSLTPDEPLRSGAEYSLRLEGLRASAVVAADGRAFQPLSLRVRVGGTTAPPPPRRGSRRAPEAGPAPPEP